MAYNEIIFILANKKNSWIVVDGLDPVERKEDIALFLSKLSLWLW